ncbi:cobalt-precorrin-6A reductase [Methylopila sp. M107]|uniref:cobalt-precorrin-6A reductase n=1 Tax=Methylopila sp. M107 TaxID=1101190 RepID=UPI000368A070|nr:cobalt-precorrin-6A reductase [Methylopila sp. M107]
MRQLRRHAPDHDGSADPAQSRDAGRDDAPRILILGGSSDGFAAAETFMAAGYSVTTSFAGVTETRRAPVGIFRVGGFGGVSGLVAYLAVENIDLIVDATHPYATQIKANAREASILSGVPLVHVVRPAWTPEPGDDWRFAPDLATAAAMTPVTFGPCFLTVGRSKIAPFANRHDVRFLIRTVDPPAFAFDHPTTLIIQGRGPFSIDDERALFEKYGVGCLVTANSGGDGAAAKLAVARERGVPVVIVDRQPPPEGLVVTTATEALAVGRDLLAIRRA